jgi:hypothetical protein
VEESNADKAIKALTAALAPRARVKRNGKVTSLEAKELVPGDIIIIQFGNIVPADVKLLGREGPDEMPMQVHACAHVRCISPFSSVLSAHLDFSLLLPALHKAYTRCGSMVPANVKQLGRSGGPDVSAGACLHLCLGEEVGLCAPLSALLRLLRVVLPSKPST